MQAESKQRDTEDLGESDTHTDMEKAEEKIDDHWKAEEQLDR